MPTAVAGGKCSVAARADRYVPLTVGDLKRMKRTPQAKIMRLAMALTQEEFAVRDPSASALLGTGSKAARSRTDQPKLI